jgi:hypothetical protein
VACTKNITIINDNCCDTCAININDYNEYRIISDD